MEVNRNGNMKLANRQVTVVRRNLVSICRFAVKSLIDKACFNNVDDDESEEFVNFCAVLEQVLMHRLRPHKTWYGGADSRHFWDYIQAACRKVPHSCISSIDAIENIRSSAAKGRAFIRCAVMEKRLSEYISTALQETKITKKFYLPGAILVTEDAAMLCGILLGLNAIDFSFCLKGENMELLGPLAIDYTPFLKFHQSAESVSSDMDEMRELSNSSLSSSIMSEEASEQGTWKIRFKNLEQKYKSVCEQKGYLEELVRLREYQGKEMQHQNQCLVNRCRDLEIESQHERQQLETVILELQGQLAAAKSEHQLQQQRLALIKASQHAFGQHIRDIQLAEIAGESNSQHGHYTESASDHNSFTSSMDNMPLQTFQQTDNRSLLSDHSGPFTTKEDSQSMVPLAGSLMDVPVHHGNQPEMEGVTPPPEEEIQKDISAGRHTPEKRSTDEDGRTKHHDLNEMEIKTDDGVQNEFSIPVDANKPKNSAQSPELPSAIDPKTSEEKTDDKNVNISSKVVEMKECGAASQTDDVLQADTSESDNSTLKTKPEEESSSSDGDKEDTWEFVSKNHGNGKKAVTEGDQPSLQHSDEQQQEDGAEEI